MPLSNENILVKLGVARWIFFRSLAAMMNAGVPLPTAIESTGKQLGQPRMSDMTNAISSALSAGHPLSRAVAAHPDFFTDFHRKLLRTGETSGRLVAVLQRLADYEEKCSTLRQRVQSQLTYPMFLFVFALLSMLFLPSLALDGLFDIIASSGVDPPLLSQIVIAASTWLGHPLVVGLVVAVVGGSPWVLSRALANPVTRERLLRLVTRLPAVGELWRNLCVAQFAQALALQLEVGTPALQALSNSASVAGDPGLNREMTGAVERLRDGSSVAGALEGVSLVTPVMVAMVAVGEECGHLPGLVQVAAQIMESEVEEKLELLVSLLEPLVMVVMGILFAILLVATMLPMVRLVETL